MPDLTTKEAFLERMVKATENLSENVPKKFDDYLPLSGGTMTGAIISSSDPVVKKASTNTETAILGSTDGNSGARIYLFGKDAGSAGQFKIGAVSSSSVLTELIGSPSGTLTWGGQNVATEDNFPRRYSMYTGSTVGGSLTVPYGQWLLIVSNLASSVPSEAHYVGLLGIGNSVGTVDIKKGSNYSGLGLTLTKSGSDCIVSVTSQYTYISAIKVLG